MVSSLQETAGLAAVDWTPKRRDLDPSAFGCGRVGPYRLGPEIRTGRLGAVNLAIGRQFDTVLELERIYVPLGEVCADRAGSDDIAARLLDRLNHCVGVKHPHVGSLLGAGLDDGIPYVLRHHRLGRTLAELQRDKIVPPPEVAAGILFGVAEAVRFLFDFGPHPGACGPGGVSASDVHIGWDGTVRVLGAGFAFVGREGEDPELEGLSRLAESLEPKLGRLMAEADSLPEAVVALRRWRREACAHRREWVGSWLRHADAEGCANLRRFFGLDTLN